MLFMFLPIISLILIICMLRYALTSVGKQCILPKSSLEDAVLPDCTCTQSQSSIFGLMPGNEESKTKENHLSLIVVRRKRNPLHFGEQGIHVAQCRLVFQVPNMLLGVLFGEQYIHKVYSDKGHRLSRERVYLAQTKQSHQMMNYFLYLPTTAGLIYMNLGWYSETLHGVQIQINWQKKTSSDLKVSPCWEQNLKSQ